MEVLVQGETNGDRQREEVRSSELLVHHSCWEILQRAVRDDGEDAGHRMQMRP
jgi:hypothetical protein